MGKIIIGFTGQMASGKGTATEYLKKKYSVATYRFSTPLRDVLHRIYVEVNRHNMQTLSSALRSAFGDDLLASIIATDASNEKNDFVVIDGIRRHPDIKYLKKIPGFHLVHIKADQKLRWERMTKRAENADDVNKTLTEFQADEKKEAEVHILEVAQTAEFTIDNNGSLENLYQNIENIIAAVHEN
ncbi:MAG: AAA family ATPase [Patescibacteria group bacterium]|nr:AAA family ATPase [Patescibacteria group bacterium]